MKGRGVLATKRRVEPVLISLPSHCCQAQKGNLDVAVSPLAAGVCSGSLLAQFFDVAGFLAVGRRWF